MVAPQPVPPEIALEFLRHEIARNRTAAPRVREAALTFGVVGRSTGLTSWWTIYVGPREVTLETGAAPLEYDGQLVTLHLTDDSLGAITRGESAADVDVDGDTEVLADLARCIRSGANLYDVRADH